MNTKQFQLGFVTALLALVSWGWAQDMTGLDDFDTMAPEAIRRKHPSFWHRPNQESPAAQFAAAAELERAGRLRKAAGEYRALVHTWHDSAEAVNAQRAYAGILETRGKYEAAFDEYQYLIDFYFGQFNYTDVLERQFRIANAVMHERHGDFLFLPGFEAPGRALSLFKKIAENAPTWQRAPEVRFYIGWIQEKDKKYEEAIQSFDTLRQRWPHHELAAAAAFAGSRCLVRLADTHKRDEESCQRALAALAGFLRDYPDDPNVTQVRAERDRLSRRLYTLNYERAAYYDQIVHRPESALIAYGDFLRRFPYAEQAEAVSARVHELEALIQSRKDSE